jgi:TPP-dependent 2-oxoacid decarboxylase
MRLTRDWNMAFTVADYVLERLHQQHVDVLFGVPAAYCAPLFDAAGSHGMATVITASDLEAGYAADGYARTKGLSAVSVAYGVGTLSMINAIAGAYVERSPVVVINGGPTAANLSNLHQFDVIFSHSIGQDATDLAAYKLVTAYAARAGKVADVPGVVDGAIAAAMTSKRPVYVEIGMDIWGSACPMPIGSLPTVNPPFGTEPQLAKQIVGLLRAAHSPVLLVGAEIQRYGLADKVADLIAKLGVRWASALLGKSTLAEEGAGWVGVYDPPHSPSAIQNIVEQADLLVTLGCVFPTGYRPLVQAAFDRMVQVYDGQVRIKTGAKKKAELGALVSALVTEAAGQPAKPVPPGVLPAGPGPAAGPLTYSQVFERIGAALDASWIVVPDTFLGIYAAANLPVKGRDAFLCSGVWASIGHSVAAALGASFGSGRRPLVICGDGGFHMTAQALATMAQYGRNPVVVVIDNGIYGYEQYLLDKSYFANPARSARPYVVLKQWDFVKLANALGVPFAQAVDTASALDASLAAAKLVNGPALIEARVGPRGLPSELS